MKTGGKIWALMAATALCAAMAGCKAARTFPDTLPGWHDAGYTTIFGRLQRVPAQTPDSPPVWVIRFGLANDPYRGQFAITPPERLVGYTGGEQVEIKGAIRPDLSYPGYFGTWFEVQNIRMWSNHQ